MSTFSIRKFGRYLESQKWAASLPRTQEERTKKRLAPKTKGSGLAVRNHQATFCMPRNMREKANCKNEKKGRRGILTTWKYLMISNVSAQKLLKGTQSLTETWVQHSGYLQIQDS